MKRRNLFVLGFIIHVIFLLSIFDIYFKSPIINGIANQISTIDTPVRRIVFISVDGLRYDSLFQKDPDTSEILAPYIFKIAKTRGALGMSQCHLPTESRPGHVAMLAGFYEDPSAVTKGWKKNPVDFDSIFNQSSCSYSWGSPDILNIFYDGLNHTCAYSNSYNAHDQVFAGNTMELDNWVYSTAKEFILNSDKELKTKLSQEKSFFFLHLLGTDTSGHTDKPLSKKFFDNLRNVDRLVRNFEALFVNFFKDSQTCFVLSSDHGMTNWGSHGAGDPSETNVPFLAWGAGIKVPQEQTNPRDPSVVDQKRMNIEQADIAPLLAVLLGTSIPVNSVGIVPLNYLDFTEEMKAKAMFFNAEQIAAQFQRYSHMIQEQSLPWLYNKFGKLTDDELADLMKSISSDIQNQEYNEAMIKSRVLIDVSFEGLHYYQNYYQTPLFTLMTSSYVAWMLYLILSLKDTDALPAKRNSLSNLIISVIFTITIGLIAIQKLPLLFYCYFLLPELLWFWVVQRKKMLLAHLINVMNWQSLVTVVLIFIGVELLVFGFFRRWVLSLSVIGMVLWPVYAINVTKVNKIIMVLWISSGFLLAIFLLLPVVGKEPQVLFIVISGALLLIFSIFSCLYPHRKESTSLSVIRCMAIGFATWNCGSVHSQFGIHQLTFTSQLTSWLLFILSFLLPFLGPTHVLQRLLHVFMSLSVPFILLTISHEGFFILTLFVNLFSWVHLEKHTSPTKLNDNPLHDSASDDCLSVSDFRRGYFFLAYISIAFFGIGNIASLNSFDPAWVRCFLTVFSPFSMSALILFKTIIPFLAVICTLRALSVTLHIRANKIFTIVLIYCNIMGLNFLYLVKNKGSWLDIGTSISHYVIQQVTVVFILLLYALAFVIMSFSITDKFTRYFVRLQEAQFDDVRGSVQDISIYNSTILKTHNS